MTRVVMRSTRIEIALPRWLYGGDLNAFASAIGWDIEATNVPDVWSVALQERAHSGSRELLRVHKIASAGTSTIANEGALALAARRVISRHIDQRPLMLQELKKLPPVVEIKNPQDLTQVLYRFDISLMAADSESAFGSVVQAMLTDLATDFPNAEAFFVEVDPALSRRLLTNRLQLRLADEASTFQVPPLAGPSGFAFEGGMWLTDDMSLGLRAFVDPLVLSLAPFAWGHTFMCDTGVLVVSFGSAVAGRSGGPNEVVDLFGREGSISSGSYPVISAHDIESALTWWIGRLSEHFTEATDPCNFVFVDGKYDVSKHQSYLLTLNHAFRSIQSISIEHRDAHSRQALLFDSLDILPELLRTSFDGLCEPAFARKALAEAMREINLSAHAVLIPRARSAVTAIESVRGGFGIGGRISSGGVSVPEPSPQSAADKQMTFDKAIARYLRIRRNANHGYGGTTDKHAEQDRILLSAHSGQLPIDLPNLSYLYALRFLARSPIIAR